MSHKILAINPGSTSTKIALYEDEKELFSANLNLEGINYKSTDGEGNLQKLKEKVISEVMKHGYAMEEIDAFSGRSGNMVPSAAGVYAINDLLLDEDKDYRYGNCHALRYSPVLTYSLAKEYGKPAYVLNSQSADELEIRARFTGFKDIWRISAVHVLNHKEVAHKAAEALGKSYSEANVIAAHMGGGVSVVAHKQGKMVDSSGCKGEGPIAPNRSGTAACLDLIDLAYSGKYTKQEMMAFVALKGGMMAHTGTDDARQIEKRIMEGDEYAKHAYNAMIYQISKHIGAMAVTLEGKVDAIALTGGLSNSKYVVGEIQRQTNWIAPLQVFAGEYEMEALANGVLRVLQGKESAAEYTGKPVFDLEAFKKTRQV